MTTRTGSGRPIPLNVYAVPSADGVASLLATVLAVSERPATLLLEELAHTEIRIEVISRTDRDLTASEHYQLDADPITSGQHHAGLLRTKGGIVAAKTELVILPQRLPAGARAALVDAHIPADKILAPLGVRRLDRRTLCRAGCLDSAGENAAVESSAVLAIGDTKVGLATERITEGFCRLTASQLGVLDRLLMFASVHKTIASSSWPSANSWVAYSAKLPGRATSRSWR